jgi:hypothetical protein
MKVVTPVVPAMLPGDRSNAATSEANIVGWLSYNAVMRAVTEINPTATPQKLEAVAKACKNTAYIALLNKSAASYHRTNRRVKACKNRLTRSLGAAIVHSLETHPLVRVSATVATLNTRTTITCSSVEPLFAYKKINAAQKVPTTSVGASAARLVPAFKLMDRLRTRGSKRSGGSPLA